MYELTYFACILDEIEQFRETGIGKYVELDFGRASGKSRAIDMVLSLDKKYIVYYRTMEHVVCSNYIRQSRSILDIDVSSSYNDIFFLDSITTSLLELIHYDTDLIKDTVQEFNKLVFKIG